MDEGKARVRSDQPDTLPEEVLDERQAAIGERRRRGGPLLEREETAIPIRPESVETPPDVPPTECEDSPAAPEEPEGTHGNS